MAAPRIAVIAFSDSFSETWPQLARFAGAELEVAGTPGAVRSLQSTCGVVISAGGVECESERVLRELHAANAPEVAVVGVDTDYRSVATLLQAGAANYFAMPGDYGMCRSWITERVEREKDRAEGARFAADERDRFDFSKMIGRSHPIRQALARAAQVIPRGNSSVLITGETGTGKEVLARALHYNGMRALGPFVEINCTTLPENLLEAELFGYEPGAFTDARVPKPGLFEVANGGTIFLDEIGDLSTPLQAKLLRVLEEKRIRRLGSVREIDLELRVVAATHVDLPAAIREGKFRQDLYYRLNVFPIRLPALRERGDDVVQLADHFLDRFSGEYQTARPKLTAEIRRALLAHPWPGNIRELRNAIERGILLGNGNLFVDDLFPDDLPNTLWHGPIPFPASLETIERAAATAMLEHCGGNKSLAAKQLGISRKHLYTLLGRKEGGSERK